MMEMDKIQEGNTLELGHKIDASNRLGGESLVRASEFGDTVNGGMMEMDFNKVGFAYTIVNGIVCHFSVPMWQIRRTLPVESRRSLIIDESSGFLESGEL
jgi:hypothetical protein